ncbi:MAG: ATP-binding protein [Treponema sp.]|jgi:predicted AAA+ superfamily ATPase|nr:ATP-binding protein [Treponema sp.]
MEIIDTRMALADITGLAVFSRLKDHPLIGALRVLLETCCQEGAGDALGLVRGWASFTDAFIRCNQGASFYVTLGLITITDDNPFTHAVEVQNREDLPPVLVALAKTDLSRLGRIAAVDIPSLGFHLGELLRREGLDSAAQNIEEEARALWAVEGKQPRSEREQRVLELFPEKTDWGSSLSALTTFIHAQGAGLLGLYTSFRWISSGNARSIDSLQPVFHPDPIGLSDLSGYEDQRMVVTANTLRFLEGKPANNLLLYGDRGTGKSATVKAVSNEYAHQGLRLLEVPKNKLFQLSGILETLGSRRLRFIIFIDDLSFETTDDSFTSLKALLEGGIEVRPSNVVIYATSNRRHLVKERLADRPSSAMAAEALATGDVRAFDTMQEQFSLADRFGLTVVFTAPGQEEFLHIAEYIACKRGILKSPLSGDSSQDGPDTEARKIFRDNALRWERWFNGRSPRTAVQYVDWVTGGEGFPWE